MTLLAVERIKLFSTRSPWWCMALTLVLSIGFAALIAKQAGNEVPLSLTLTEYGYRFGRIVMMVMAALAVTTEYRFGTMRASFQATPKRSWVLLAKTTVVAGMTALIGELTAFGSWGVARLLAPNADLAIRTADDWRQVAGIGLVFAVSAVLGVAVGILVRHTAGAVSLLMIWALLVESLVGIIPSYGQDIQKWMPFTVADHFLTAGGQAMRSAGPSDMPFGPWGSLAYFAAIAAGLLVVALISAERRDA